MADDCCDSFGGRITVEINGKLFSARGEITINPTTSETTAEANHDGSPYFTVRPTLATAALSFTDPCNMQWEDEMQRCKVNVSIVEVTNNRSHLFTKARIVGRPSINISTGEVTGLSIASAHYRRI